MKSRRRKKWILDYNIEKEMVFLNNKVIRKAVFRMGVVFVIFILGWIQIAGIKGTGAFYNDTETSSENSHQAGLLDFSLRSGQNNFVPGEKSGNMKPGDSVARDIYIKREDGLPLKYTASAEPVEDFCDLELYQALQLKVWYNWYDAEPGDPPNHLDHRHMDLKYNGLLKDFNLRVLDPDDPDLQIPNSHSHFDNIFYGLDEHWFYASEIILPSEVSLELQNKSCKFNFVFDGWQTNFSLPGQGFSDTESIDSTITTRSWMPEVEIIYPVGEEVWYLVPPACPIIDTCSAWCVSKGMNAQCEYPIRWTAVNQIGLDQDLLIDIYFSNDSGNTWFDHIVADTDNDGLFEWKPPYNSSYVTDEARIKIVAHHKDYSLLLGEDESEDFCPPMMTLFDIMAITNSETVGATSGGEGYSGIEEEQDEPVINIEPVAEEPVLEPILETATPSIEPVIVMPEPDPVPEPILETATSSV